MRLNKNKEEILYTGKGDNSLINKRVFVFKIMSYDCLEIFLRMYLFYFFPRKILNQKEKEVEKKERKKRKDGERKETEE